MNAPEKIYLYPSDRAGEEYDNEWGTIPWGQDYVEYTRTNAFIENVEEYLKNQFIKDVSVLAGGIINIDFTIAIKNFVKYIKGEQ